MKGNKSLQHSEKNVTNRLAEVGARDASKNCK